MSPQSTKPIIGQPPTLSAQDAWRLWRQLNQLQELLWNAYEQQFMEFSIQEAKDHNYCNPLPFE
jgi:hypothetical protein